MKTLKLLPVVITVAALVASPASFADKKRHAKKKLPDIVVQTNGADQKVRGEIHNAGKNQLGVSAGNHFRGVFDANAVSGGVGAQKNADNIALMSDGGLLLQSNAEWQTVNGSISYGNSYRRHACKCTGNSLNLGGFRGAKGIVKINLNAGGVAAQANNINVGVMH